MHAVGTRLKIPDPVELTSMVGRCVNSGVAYVAMESGDAEAILKSTKATVKVTREQNEETKKLLRLMGVPVVEAPSEAEATCAALCRDGKVFAAATEDADCLTFGTRLLIRNLMAAESQKKQILEVNLALLLEQLNITMDQFIDFCILCGCDYCDTLKGVGPSTAIKLMVQHGTLEKVLEALGPEKLPANFKYEAAAKAGTKRPGAPAGGAAKRGKKRLGVDVNNPETYAKLRQINRDEPVKRLRKELFRTQQWVKYTSGDFSVADTEYDRVRRALDEEDSQCLLMSRFEDKVPTASVRSARRSIQAILDSIDDLLALVPQKEQEAARAVAETRKVPGAKLPYKVKKPPNATNATVAPSPEPSPSNTSSPSGGAGLNLGNASSIPFGSMAMDTFS
ncbi:unnamed protein product [Effrenium voratum]|nr:unnamed protein product [Effrenium voratum]